jgi:hypothetical protein
MYLFLFFLSTVFVVAPVFWTDLTQVIPALADRPEWTKLTLTIAGVFLHSVAMQLRVGELEKKLTDAHQQIAMMEAWQKGAEREMVRIMGRINGHERHKHF